MDLGTMIRVMIKRWYVSVPSLVLALTLPVVAWFAVPAKYASTSTISLLNSAAASSGQNRTGNPFTAFDNSLTGMADYLARTLNSDQSMADLAGQGVTDLAAAELAPNASGPFITLTITGKDPQKILAEMKTFDDFAIAELASIQNKTSQNLQYPLPANTLLRAIVMVPPQKPIASMKSKLEDVAGAGVGGMVLLFVSTFGAEALAIRRGRPASVPRNSDTGRNTERTERTERNERTERTERAERSTERAADRDADFDLPAPSPAPGPPPRRPRRPRRPGAAPRRAAPAGRAAPSRWRAPPRICWRPSTSRAPGRRLGVGRPGQAPSLGEHAHHARNHHRPPRYREADHDSEDDSGSESWIDIESRPLEDLAVGDRDPGTR
ncbi:hypothetical protein ACFQ9X_00900 [Catenulispora yoronensis]